MIEPLPLLAGTTIVLIVAFTGVWLAQIRTGNAGIVDVAWSAAIGLAAIADGILSDGIPSRRLLVGAMGGLWSLRLAAYLIRRVSTHAEDGRYQALRAQHGARIQLFLFWFFQLQAVSVVLFTIPMLLAMRASRPRLGWQDALGFAIWMTAIVGEAVADAQLARFRAGSDSRGHVCRAGLWRYSRHPNYFFEWLHWFAYVAIGSGAPGGWLTLLGPVMMLFFLWKVTGIPVTEEHALRSRGEEYRRYQRTTSVLIPWFPRRGAE